MKHSYIPLGSGENFVRNGEFIILHRDSRFKAARDFLIANNARIQEVDTGFMGIMGELLLDAETDTNLKYPRFVKFAVKPGPEGDVATTVHSLDYLDVNNLKRIFEQHGAG